MPATTTLSITSLAAPCGKDDPQIKVASTSGITAGMRLFIDRELMSVVSLGVSTLVNVRRGVDGTLATAHTAAFPMYIGAADQFYNFDPQGKPPEAVLVSPHINVLTGDVWFAQGESGPNAVARWWQKQVITYTQGPLGYPSGTADPTSST